MTRVLAGAVLSTRNVVINDFVQSVYVKNELGDVYRVCSVAKVWVELGGV